MKAQDKRRIAALRKRVDAARDFPTHTDPYSRHLHMIAEALLKPKKDGSLRYPMLKEEPEHCAETMLNVLASLWEARKEFTKEHGPADHSAAIAELTKKLMPPDRARIALEP